MKLIAAVLVALAAVSLAGCVDYPPDGTRSPSAGATVVPGGNATADCAASRPVPGPAAVTPADLAVGPLLYPGLAEGFAPGQSGEQGEIRFYKIGVELPADASATVSIGSAARDFAGIVIETGPDAGYSSVTYTSCSSAIQTGLVFWVGGFSLVGRETACVPLDVQIRGEASARHVILSIGAGKCD